ncbi:MAG: helical backbone metal receptor [candidate division WOR-3 bacterium]|nr:helical backbone metal receptor [candidate division WOR-3 bacterium]MCX7837617.1 helical backbone metal receptor [candidate division WOR-3 bacterium]MDW8114029.1 helical backbone metal receptor [candidate division WOR-3 bacterium]
MREIIFLLFFILFLFFCASPPKDNQIRVVSLSPAVTEIIFALNCEKYLVGNTIYCDFPEKAKEIYKVGDMINPSIERIAKLKPTIVFLTYPLQKNIDEKLKTLNIRTFNSSPKSLNEMFEEIIKIGEIFNKKERAEKLVESLKKELDEIRKLKKRLKVYIEINTNPPITIGKNSFLNDLLENIGVENIFADKVTDYPIVKQEEIILKNPDYIIILHPKSKAKEIASRLGFEKVKAVRFGKIVDNLNPDYFLRNSPRIIEGAKILVNLLNNEEQ